jgi:NAD(P)-dependent dehydrogenase (short-subunit alcohol dehydrogenase family)
VATILVTGASSGIGEACALSLDKAGHVVFGGVRSEQAVERLCSKSSERMRPIILDITVPEQVARAVVEIERAVGADGLDGLVNNAGIAIGGPVEFVEPDEWRRQFEVNVIGQVAVTQAMLPLIRRAKGRIVFVGSIAGRVATPLGGPYGASKHALAGVVEALRSEIHRWGIKISIVEPPAVNTPIWEKGVSEATSLIPELPPLAEFYYGDQLRRLQEQVRSIGKAAPPPDKTVEAIAHALFARRPKLRYLPGTDAQLIGFLLRVLPDRVVAELLRRSGP